MKFTYCPDCGELLSSRTLGDEGAVPWCDCCDKPWFDMFPSAIIALVYNENNEILLLRQGYISTEYCNLVSGYIKPGENAEETAVREIFEETGQVVDTLTPVQTNWFAKKEMMMLGFFANVHTKPVKLSQEVDQAFWTTPQEALRLVHPFPTSTSRILVQRFIDTLTK